MQANFVGCRRSVPAAGAMLGASAAHREELWGGVQGAQEDWLDE